jgi:regulator of nucleoside diphosphate kinase
MSDRPFCKLTTKDLSILEVMLERLGEPSGDFGRLLRRKINSAELYFRDEIPPKVVTLNSRVSYRVDDGALETALIVHDDGTKLPRPTLSIQSRLGLALLGLAEGQSIAVERDDGPAEVVVALTVELQPEAEMRRRERQAAEASTVVAFRPKPRPVFDFGGNDDPGPSAA